MAVKALKEGKTFSAVDDQFGSPSFAKDVSEALAVLLEKRKEFASGIYHLVNESERPASKYEIAKEGIGMLRLSADLEFVRGDLREHGSCTLAHVGGPGVDDDAAVGEQPDGGV